MPIIISWMNEEKSDKFYSDQERLQVSFGAQQLIYHNFFSIIIVYFK